ncbi:MAG: hypothetical protein R3C27_06560 [Hyphomonadaceae bacterium]
MQAEYGVQNQFGQPVLIALFFSMGPTGPATVDDWIIATLGSVVLSVVLGYFELAIEFATGGL